MTALIDPVLSSAPRYPIRVVARKVGMTEATIRAWERRHGAVEPARSGGRQRLYSDADIDRLTLLRTLTSQGTSISTLASMSSSELRQLAPAPGEAAPVLLERRGASVGSVSRDMAVCTRAVAALDADRLYHTLMRLVLEQGPLAFLDDIATPLCSWIGDEWGKGRLNEAQEHSASEVIRRVLGFILQTLRRERRERHVVLATLSGERHEFGAMMAGIIAAHDGWSYNYLGADLPATAIASAVKRLQAPIIAVSIVAPSVPSQPARDLVALRRAVGRNVQIVVGGSSAPVVDHVLREAKAVRVSSLREWRELLAERPAGNS